MKYNKTNHHVHLINYHLVWCPKRRKPILIDNVKQRLNQLIRQIAEQINIEIIEFVIMPNHIHLFISSSPILSAHKIIKSFKGITSRILRKEFKHLLKLPSLWTHSYFCSTAGNVSTETIKKYIEAQSKQ